MSRWIYQQTLCGHIGMNTFPIGAVENLSKIESPLNPLLWCVLASLPVVDLEKSRVLFVFMGYGS
jgi:hypothetical protein